MQRSFLALFLGTFSLASVQAATFDAVAGFSGANPSGPWTYGVGTVGTSTFSAMPQYIGNGCFGVSGLACWQSAATYPYVALNGTGGVINYATVIAPTGVLWLHPGTSSDAIVEWTAPTAGTYNINGFFELLDVSPTGVVGNVYQGSTQLYSGLLTGPGAASGAAGGKNTFSLTETLKAGDIIQFGLNNDGNYLNDSTGFDVTITSGAPEPGSMALVCAGMVALFLSGKRRRMTR